jgi:hypothetical protein
MSHTVSSLIPSIMVAEDAGSFNMMTPKIGRIDVTGHTLVAETNPNSLLEGP